MQSGRNLHGWLVLDKPAGISSTQALNRLRRHFGVKKAGHAGTLDPLASGVLPIAFGEATKTIAFAMDGIKRYRFTVRWGIATDSDDAAGAIVAQSPLRPARAAIEAVLPKFVGDPVLQRPPAFSALHVEGRRAYQRARAGERLSLPPRPVAIHALRLIAMPDSGHAVFALECGKGVYVRAIARDLGEMLNTCAHVTALRRTRSGMFSLTQAVSLEGISPGRISPPGILPSESIFPVAKPDEMRDRDSRRLRLMPVSAALEGVPGIAVDSARACALRSGRAVALADAVRLGVAPGEGGGVSAHSGYAWASLAGEPVALGRIQGGWFRPSRVFSL